MEAALPSLFDLVSILLVMTAGFAWFNRVFIHLPHTIGLLVMAVASSLLLILLDLAVPDVHLREDLSALVRHIDFQQTVPCLG
jgi:CPA1 family monovalent cation:H+ antiporter